MKKFLLMSVVVAFVIAMFMLLSETDRLQEGEIAQSGSIEISNSLSYKHDVLYPENRIVRRFHLDHKSMICWFCCGNSN